MKALCPLAWFCCAGLVHLMILALKLTIFIFRLETADFPCILSSFRLAESQIAILTTLFANTGLKMTSSHECACNIIKSLWMATAWIAFYPVLAPFLVISMCFAHELMYLFILLTLLHDFFCSYHPPNVPTHESWSGWPHQASGLSWRSCFCSILMRFCLISPKSMLLQLSECTGRNFCKTLGCYNLQFAF